jgi:dihydroxy-acid dehydratase
MESTTSREDDTVSDRLPGLTGSLTEYGDEAFSLYIRTAFMRGAGLDRDDWERPVVGIGHTISDFTPCHREMPALLEAVKRGVYEAGGLPMVFPLASLGEIMMNPTTMVQRNLASLEAEEMIRSQPMDAVALLGGCDKTVPAQVMGGISAGYPMLEIVAGPMYSGRFRGERIGACTDCRRFWGEYRGGRITADDADEANEQLAPTGGTCMVMGTASTMAILTEVLGMALPHSATAPAPSGDRLNVGARSGRALVEMAHARRTPATILSRASFDNAAVVLGAIGGSTNALVHLVAIARRAGFDIDLFDLVEPLDRSPVIVGITPAGTGFLEDLHHAGGVPALIRELAGLLDLEALTATGESLGSVIEEPTRDHPVLYPIDDPLYPRGGLRVLRGTLAPDWAVIKTAAASPELLQHRGRAVVFDSLADLAARIDLVDCGPSDVLILRNAGPVAEGMPEAGSFPIPRPLATSGVTDMVRISDARMSGTAKGTIVLHVSPEAAVGGPLSLGRDGDIVVLDAAAGRLDLNVDPAELATRVPVSHRGATTVTRWRRIQGDHVGQADRGADLD